MSYAKSGGDNVQGGQCPGGQCPGGQCPGGTMSVPQCIDYNECHCRRRSSEKNVVNFCKEAPESSTALRLFLFSVPLLYFILSIELSSMLELS